MKGIRVNVESLMPQLRRVLLFRYLSDESIKNLLGCSHFVEAEDGEYFIHEHEIESRVYVILEGSCAVMVQQEDHEAYVATLGPGQVVGEAAIFANRPRTASVVSQGVSRLLCFERGEFLRVLRDEPSAGMRVLFVMVHNLLSKLREVNLELAFERRDNAPQEDVDALIESLMNGNSDS